MRRSYGSYRRVWTSRTVSPTGPEGRRVGVGGRPVTVTTRPDTRRPCATTGRASDVSRVPPVSLRDRTPFPSEVVIRRRRDRHKDSGVGALRMVPRSPGSKLGLRPVSVPLSIPSTSRLPARRPTECVWVREEGKG